MPQKLQREVRSLSVFTEKFTEGEWHVFKVLKTITIPGEESYFVLESNQSNRLLLPHKHYKSYNIKPGCRIKCRIDKINCSGKIFLEPEHPFLIPGKYYDFKILKKEVLLDRKGREFTRYLLAGNDNINCHAIFEDNLSIQENDHIYAKLIRTRKGILILSEIRLINNC